MIWKVLDVVGNVGIFLVGLFLLWLMCMGTWFNIEERLEKRKEQKEKEEITIMLESNSERARNLARWEEAVWAQQRQATRQAEITMREQMEYMLNTMVNSNTLTVADGQDRTFYWDENAVQWRIESGTAIRDDQVDSTASAQMLNNAVTRSGYVRPSYACVSPQHAAYMNKVFSRKQELAPDDERRFLREAVATKGTEPRNAVFGRPSVQSGMVRSDVGDAISYFRG